MRAERTPDSPMVQETGLEPARPEGNGVTTRDATNYVLLLH